MVSLKAIFDSLITMAIIVAAIFVLSLSAMAESYNQLDSSVRSLQTKIEERKNKIKELGEKKITVKDAGAQRAIMDEMVVAAREMKESFVKFQAEKKKLKYQFPNRGDETERQYKRFEVQIVEDLNSFSNMDLRLKGVLSRIEKSYGKPPEVVKKEEAQKAQTAAKSETLQSKEPETTEVLHDRPKLSY